MGNHYEDRKCWRYPGGVKVTAVSQFAAPEAEESQVRRKCDSDLKLVLRAEIPRTRNPVKMSQSNLPAYILNLLGFTSSGKHSNKKGADCEDSEPADLTNKVRKLVLDNHRTMFYTVTLSPTTQRKVVESFKHKTPSLKWQCASSLSKCHMLLARTNTNSNKYYSFTYLDDDLSSGEVNIPAKEDLLRANKSFSPIKIYIET